MFKTIERLPKKWKDRIDDISDERSCGDGIWIYLKNGYTTYEDSQIIHEDTLAECIFILKETIQK